MIKIRKLTLNEKISIKGELVRKLGPSPTFTKMTDIKEAVHFWNMCFDRSIIKFLKGRNGYKIAIQMAKERREADANKQ